MTLLNNNNSVRLNQFYEVDPKLNVQLLDNIVFVINCRD